MQTVTEQQIQAMAPNANAVANGRKISKNGGFVRLERSEDATFYFGECKGSGKSNYMTSVDFIEPQVPVCRCSCPSRQFPCKHGIALLFEIMENKKFEICEIPEDILKKREKKAKKQEAASGDAGTELTEEEKAKKKAASAKASKSAKSKKLKKQLEGLALVEKLVKDLLSAGLGTLGGTSVKTYAQIAKQLGDYYLSGPQILLNGLIIQMTEFQKDGLEEHYDEAISILEKLWTLTKKSKDYITKKLESDDVDLEETELYEELGGIWKIEELKELGRYKENAEFMQLAFWIDFDEARQEYIDTGCFIDLATGEIYMNYNYRPVKKLKYIKQEDSIFGVVAPQLAAYYPGQGNLRIRWNGAAIREVETKDYDKLHHMAAQNLTDEVKSVKNILKNALAPSMLIRLIAYERIGKCDEAYVLETSNGETIMLGNAKGMENTVERISLLPDKILFYNQLLLGAFYYDAAERRLKLQPLSIVTDNSVVRLLY